MLDASRIEPFGLPLLEELMGGVPFGGMAEGGV